MKKTRLCDNCNNEYTIPTRGSLYCSNICELTASYNRWLSKKEPRKIDLEKFWYHKGEKVYYECEDIKINLHADILLYDYVGEYKVIIGYKHEQTQT